MVARTMVRLGLVIGQVALVAACEAPKPTPGADSGTDTNAAMITWTDGRQAIKITCGMPGGCQSRALAMCRGNYTVLDMENMPTRGDAAEIRGTGTVVVRCAS